MRTTAIAELRRGVTGDPADWMAATGIAPKTIEQMVGSRAATIQDKWFARLFLVKALIIASLALFWLVSGFIALVISYRCRRRHPAHRTISRRRWLRRSRSSPA